MSTPSLSALPAELIAFVIDHLDRLKDLSALARTDRKLYSSANPIVYKRAVSQGDAWPLAWAAHCGVAGTLKRVLAAGVGPDHQFVDQLPFDDWKRVNAAARQPQVAVEDHVDWDADNGSESTAEWSIETEDSDPTATTHQPSSNSNSEPWSWGPAANDSDRDSDVWMDDEPVSLRSIRSDTLDEQEREGAAGLHASGDNMIVRRYNALHLAVQAGHHDIVQILLDHGASINASCERLCECTRLYGLLNAAECPEPTSAPPSWSSLHLAICHSRPETAKLLLSRGASPIMDPPADGDESQCVTALHHAAAMGMVDILRYLLDNGAQKDVNIRDAKTLTPLYHAYAERRWDAIAFLVERGADINVDVKVYLPYSTITPLGEACRLGHFESASRLADLGADPNRGFIITEIGKGLTPLHLCAMPSARPVRAPRSPEDPFLRLTLEAQKAALLIQAIRKLISKGAVLDTMDCSGDTPLIAAAQNHNVPALRALITAGVNVHGRNTVGRTALMQAIMGPQNPVAATLNDENPEPLAQSVQILIGGGARLDERDSEGNTILHLVFKGSNTFHSMQKAALRILMNSPAVAELSQVRDKDNHTPLQLAFQARNLEACDVLVRRGCVRGVVDQAELMTMFADALASPGDQDTLDFVLDLDVHGVLTSDPAIFSALLAKSKYTAIRAARAVAQRGLPALAPADATRLLSMAIRMGETALASSLMACGGDLAACDAHVHSVPPPAVGRGRRIPGRR
ncbi:ankyrin repeat-containing domain protein [Podospora aff. communis PSN243]|uniref:Ankyrin repeat-containing domain protein n=1 Tax=Podospora aff. communis PSN243 TaxID=3040156 RepID=A0AAV9GC40_9PEZI|nr:ankyrin repeat-containing domain protein [Podospora aff. communis PSN243]